MSTEHIVGNCCCHATCGPCAGKERGETLVCGPAVLTEINRVQQVWRNHDAFWKAHKMYVVGSHK